jgi:hypothetical protein
VIGERMLGMIDAEDCAKNAARAVKTVDFMMIKG